MQRASCAKEHLLLRRMLPQSHKRDISTVPRYRSSFAFRITGLIRGSRISLQTQRHAEWRFDSSFRMAKKLISSPFHTMAFPSAQGKSFSACKRPLWQRDPTKPHPWPVEVFLSTRPRALKFVQDPKPTPVSFATEAFFGNNAWIFINQQRVKQAGRYQVLPVAGQHYVSDADGKSKTPNFLIEELKTHLAQEPVKFRLLLQLPNPGDSTNDASLVWPADRKTIDLGTITITRVGPDSDAAQKALAFDPTRLTDGIELSYDPLAALRSRVTGCQGSIARVCRARRTTTRRMS